MTNFELMIINVLANKSKPEYKARVVPSGAFSGTRLGLRTSKLEELGKLGVSGPSKVFEAILSNQSR